MITSHRDHGYALACGMEPRAVMAELTGRIGGASRGKGGSMHIFAPDQDFYGGHGIVGAPASLGSGLAFANRYRSNGRVAFVVFGEGAANQGQVYECFNMAALWRLPALYIIENNRYAMGTAVERSASTAADMAPAAPPMSSAMAVLPKTVIQTKVKPAGTSRTPRMNSRTVRPREMRAMNMPTKGDQAIHQAQ